MSPDNGSIREELLRLRTENDELL